MDVPQQHLPGGARAVNHHAVVIGPLFLKDRFFKHQQTERKPHQSHQSELQQRPPQMIGHGHPPMQQRFDEHAVGRRDAQRGGGNMGEFRKAHIPPHHAVQPEEPKNDHCAKRIQGDELLIVLQIHLRNVIEPAVEPQPQRHKIRPVHGKHIIKYQTNGNFTFPVKPEGQFLLLMPVSHSKNLHGAKQGHPHAETALYKSTCLRMSIHRACVSQVSVRCTQKLMFIIGSQAKKCKFFPNFFRIMLVFRKDPCHAAVSSTAAQYHVWQNSVTYQVSCWGVY